MGNQVGNGGAKGQAGLEATRRLGSCLKYGGVVMGTAAVWTIGAAVGPALRSACAGVRTSLFASTGCAILRAADWVRKMTTAVRKGRESGMKTTKGVRLDDSVWRTSSASVLARLVSGRNLGGALDGDGTGKVDWGWRTMWA